MGRTYYASSKRTEPGHDRLIHVLSTPDGTVVLAMRPPEPGERGYAVGVDFTVMSAVKEMFADWDGDEPGWLQEPRKSVASEISTGDDQTYDVTILAAFEIPEHQRDEETPSEEEAADFVRQEEAIHAIREIAESDFRNLSGRPTWLDVCEVWSEDMKFTEACATLGDHAASANYSARFDELEAARLATGVQ
jgi:hypothetical protein